MAEKITLEIDDLALEGRYAASSHGRGVVITHPHPQYGGDMHNPVVEAIDHAYQLAGFATLRFNFRGTGGSAGAFDHGVGEQSDVAAAVAFLTAEGLGEIHLAGYSFGAWVNARVLQGGLSVHGMTMVAPPVAFIAFDAAIRLPVLSVVIAGSRDAFAPPDLILPAMARWNPASRLEVIHGADHFFFGYLNEVTRRLVQRLQPPP